LSATVVVATVPGHSNLLRSDYLIRHVAEHWRPLGVEFELTTSPRVSPPGDIGWQHLDTTRVAEDYQELIARYAVAINRGPSDVHKRSTATHLVARDDPWHGPVIVKTDLNYGGRTEDWAHRWRPLRHPLVHAFRDRLPARLTGRMAPDEYPIYSSKALVPSWVWRDRRFVVQRFLTEQSDGLYGIRRWFFFGDREFAYLAYSPAPIVSGDNHSRWEQLGDPPPGLRARRAELGLDYGKIDYAEVENELVVYDVSPTISADGPPGSSPQRQMIAELVPGLGGFLEHVEERSAGAGSPSSPL